MRALVILVNGWLDSPWDLIVTGVTRKKEIVEVLHQTARAADIIAPCRHDSPVFERTSSKSKLKKRCTSNVQSTSSHSTLKKWLFSNVQRCSSASETQKRHPSNSEVSSSEGTFKQ